MNGIYGLLNLNPEILENFALQGRDIEKNEGNARILRESARRLKEIGKSVMVSSARPDFSTQSVDEVVGRIKAAAAKRDSKAQWSIRDLRIASYYMMRFQNSQLTFTYAIDLLKQNWRDLFINGLVFFLLNSWNTCSEDIRHQAYELLRDKLSKYSGGIHKYQQFRNHAELFDDEGPLRLSEIVWIKKIKLEESPTILGFKSSIFSYPYFSDVILNYIKKLSCSDLDYIEDILEKHTLDRTKKLAMAKLIVTAERSGDVLQQDLVSRSARRVLISDISLPSTWAPFTGATEEEIILLKKAHELVTAWYARKSVEAFFEVVCQDPRRRLFWIKYTDYVKDFRIVGSTLIRTKLLSDGRVSTMLPRCFIETNSRVSTTAALVLYIGDKVFVEFSDTGSLYIYNDTNRLITPIKRLRSIDNTKDLKQPSMAMAVEQEQGWYGSKYYSHNLEGRLTHQGEWEDRLRWWLKSIMNLSPRSVHRSQQRQHGFLQAAENSSTRTSTFKRKVHQPSLFDDTDQDPCDSYSQKLQKMDREPELGKPVKFIFPTVVSKSLFGDKIRIIASAKGYFVELLSKHEFVSINKNVYNQRGSIWIKQPDRYDYMSIVHAFAGEEKMIGKIKDFGTFVLFTKNDSDSGVKILY